MPEADINEITPDAASAIAEADPLQYSIALTPEEYNELEMLISVERNGEDVTLAAFRHLCPTGEENSFDQGYCELYRSLACKGMIEGAEVGEGFFFFGIADLGRNAIMGNLAPTADFENRKNFANTLGSIQERFGVDMRTVAASVGCSAVVGLIAGIVGALIGNAIA